MKKCYYSLLLFVVMPLMFPANILAGNARIVGISVGDAKLVHGRTEEHGMMMISDSINKLFSLETLADEHTTILQPNTLQNHDDYRFFVTGLVLSGGNGPDNNNEWTLGVVKDYMLHHAITHGKVVCSKSKLFGPPLRGKCPPEDATFDLSYAANGAVIIDPTRPRPEGLLMIYEGTNKCSGASDNDETNTKDKKKKKDKSGHYAVLGVATSLDYGRLWPFYRNNYGSSTDGPHASAAGEFGENVCISNENCLSCKNPKANCKVPLNYGRYPVLMPTYTIEDAMGDGQSITMGYQCPSAFLDDVNADGDLIKSDIYVYSVQNFGCKDKHCAHSQPGLSVSRALINGKSEKRLAFMNWYKDPAGAKGSFQKKILSLDSSDDALPDSVKNRCMQKNGKIEISNTGLGNDCGGLSSPIGFIKPKSKDISKDTSKYDLFKSCLDENQNRLMGSISYVRETRQYLLMFVCNSPRNPNPNPLAGKTVGTSLQTPNSLTAKTIGTPTTSVQMPNSDDICLDGKGGEALFFSTADNLSEQGEWSTPQQILNSWKCKTTIAEMEGEMGGSNTALLKAKQAGKKSSGKKDDDKYCASSLWYPSIMSLDSKPGYLNTSGYVFSMAGCMAVSPEGFRRYMSRTFTIHTSAELTLPKE